MFPLPKMERDFCILIQISLDVIAERWGRITISSGFCTEMDTADMGVIQLTALRIDSGIVSCPLSLIMLVDFIFSEYQKAEARSM